MTGLPETYTSAEVAASFRKSIDWLYDKVAAGLVTPARDGEGPRAAMIWTRADVDKLHAALRPVAAPARRTRNRRAA